MYNDHSNGKVQIFEERGFFMDAYIARKTCQTYEVDDFQHNFEVSRNRSENLESQRWGLHIHSTYYEVLVFVSGNVDFWIEGKRKKL